MCVDRKYETVILPIYGVSTPFHISTIKVFICLGCTDSLVMEVVFEDQKYVVKF